MKILSICLALLLSGCVSTYSPIPDDYQGETSKIDSSFEWCSTGKADLFYLSKVNGKNIYNSLSSTRNASDGQGFSLSIKLINTNVPSQKATFSIIGRTVHATPIQALTDEVYEIKGDIVFVPEPGKEYIVKGLLGSTYSAVWIEEKVSGEVINKKIEINGNTELSFLQK